MTDTTPDVREALHAEAKRLADRWNDLAEGALAALLTGSEPGTPGRREMLSEKAALAREAEPFFDALEPQRSGEALRSDEQNAAAQEPRSGESGDARHQVANQAPPPVAAAPALQLTADEIADGWRAVKQNGSTMDQAIYTFARWVESHAARASLKGKA